MNEKWNEIMLYFVVRIKLKQKEINLCSDYKFILKETI